LEPLEPLKCEPSVSPGWTTTEFWTNALLISGVILLIALNRITLDDAVKLWPLFASSGLYSLGRGIAKGQKG
jgi:hypothetical protein